MFEQQTDVYECSPRASWKVAMIIYYHNRLRSLRTCLKPAPVYGGGPLSAPPRVPPPIDIVVGQRIISDWRWAPGGDFHRHSGCAWTESFSNSPPARCDPFEIQFARPDLFFSLFESLIRTRQASSNQSRSSHLVHRIAEPAPGLPLAARRSTTNWPILRNNNLLPFEPEAKQVKSQSTLGPA